MQPVLFDAQGNRKYLTAKERANFLKAAEGKSPDVRTFCMVLTHTGCRISEALELSADRIDFEAGVIVFESLKKRRKGMFRAVPIPTQLLDALDFVHGVRQKQNKVAKYQTRLWPWARNTAWRHVKDVMEEAGIVGSHATPKGLRHAFGVAAVQKQIPLNLVQKWLGHSRLETTAIYADAVGAEERSIAKKMWNIKG